MQSPLNEHIERSPICIFNRRRINNCHDIVHKSPLGIMEPRKGGLPVRLTYFITPYDLINITQKSHINPTIDG